ncbi:MAG: GNAT family N-acetyltransferase [Kofleriaceae bacterium]
MRALALDLWTRTRLHWGFITDALAQQFRRDRSIGAQERRFLAETLYGMVRHLRRIDLALGRARRGAAPRDLDRVLTYLVLEDLLPVADAAAAVPDVAWDEVRAVDELIARERRPAVRLGLTTGLPDWLAQRLLDDWGDDAAALAEALNRRAPMTVRANTLRGDRASLATTLADAGLATSPGAWSETALHVDTRTNLFGLDAFKAGAFEAQDEGSQLLAELALAGLAPSARKLVVDLCAGAGGKTLAMAAAMQNRGRILATDVDGKKLEELRRRARRAGVSNMQAQTLDDGAFPAALDGARGKADLVDAPCSGTGALRRNLEARYRLHPSDLDALARTQRTILATALAVVRPGGLVTYATCSILRSENQAVVAEAVRRGGCEQVPLSTVWGEARATALGDGTDLVVTLVRHGTDGFYAVLRRTCYDAGDRGTKVWSSAMVDLTASPPPPLELTVVRDVAALRALAPAWRALAGGAHFRGPDWLLPWWQAYHRTLGGELHVIVGHAGGELVCLVPLYARTARGVLDVRELRLMGDAGPRPPALNMVSSPGEAWKDRCGAAVARLLADTSKDWDVLDLEPLADPSRMRATVIARLADLGFTVESSPSAGGARRVALVGVEALHPSAGTVHVADDEATLRKSMSALRRLSRLEWAERDEHSPLADAEAQQLLEEVAGMPGARVVRLDEAVGEAVAVALVVDDRERAVVVAMAVDPQAPATAAQRLLAAEAIAAASRGRTSLEVCSGATEHPLPALPTSRRSAVALRVWRPGAGATVSRTVRSVQRGARRAVTSPITAAAQARAAWTRIRSAAANVAGVDRMSLVRGQLWTRGIEPPPGLTLTDLTEAGFDALDEPARAELLEQLALDEARARAGWGRGARAVLASLGSRPAGIVRSHASRCTCPSSASRSSSASTRPTCTTPTSPSPRAAARSRRSCSSTSRAACARLTRTGRGR